ncbi:MAG TPA: TlpA disulfide reductase family protein [Thermoanaerobaculia bacterium]|nr:TlpA disulfide reductase family protein [Thermoanaerobaculia bacterium]
MSQRRAATSTAVPAADASSGVEPRQLSRQTQVLVALLAAAALAVVFWPRGDGTREAPGGFLIDAGGRPVPVGSRMAPVTLMHFWATWCPPCRTEVPSLSQLAEDFGDYRGDFSVLMVSVADRVDEVEKFMEETLVENRFNSVLYDPSWEVTHRYGTRKLPETYLVVQGRVVERWIGAQDWNDPEIRQTILEAVLGLREPERTAAAP